MKIALDWIADYLSPVPNAEAAADSFMNAGLPVESIVDAEGVKGPTKVLDVEVTSNRTDCFCHIGLARELGALTAGTFAMPQILLKESATQAASLTRVEVQDVEGCPYYSARIIRNVKVAPSPDWLKRRLESIGLRPVNNVVDVTNFVLMELGQPLHAFDFDALQENRIVVRGAAKGEKMQAIDGREYALEPSMLVIADAKNPVAIAGVMGGKGTEVAENTVNILLESARFDPLSIRTTSRVLGLKSDSSYRFERGIDPTMADVASRRAAQLILEVAGGELAQDVVAQGIAAAKSLEVTMRFKRFQQVVGIPIAKERAVSILTALGFSSSSDPRATAGIEDDVLNARIPSHRLDVDREIDLIEEISRVHGYKNVPALDRVSHAVKPESVREKAMRAVRGTMVEAGFSEAVTVTFIPEAEAKPFVAADATLIHPQHAGWKADVLRPSLLPSLLAVRRTNQYAGIPDARVFETASILEQRGDATKTAPEELKVLAAVAGDISPLTALLTLLPDRLNPQVRMWVEPADFAFFVRGAAGRVMIQNGSQPAHLIGHVGLFTEEIWKRYDLRHACAGIELDWEPLLRVFEPTRRAAAVPRFPGVTRDLSVVVEESTRWADIQSAIAAASLSFLEKIDFVTTFRNAQIGTGKKSLTLTLNFRDPARTLKSEEVDAQVATAVKLLAEKFAALLRA
jgi:phenylalanyl-tRNA synthetase beta chain